MSDKYDFDLFTIGAGSGGVRASRVAAAHGAKVAIAEEHRVGGTCVIRGCVPKKMLIYGAHFAEDLKDARNFGWSTENAKFDWVTLRDNVLNDVDRLEGAYTETLENNDVSIYHERAEITGPHEITLASGTKVTAKHILIATGARPRMPECQGAEHAISSNEAFHLDELPKKIIIAGGGYIANEFAGIFNEFGCDVHIVNRGDKLLRSYDEAVRDRLLQISTMKGIKFRVVNNPLNVATFKALGANPTPMAFSEVFVALQTGTMDGQENPLTNIVGANFQEVQKYLSLTDHVYSPTYLTSGAETWAGLPDDVKTAVSEIAAEVQDWSLAEGEKADGTLVEKVKAAGVEVNDADKAAFVAASQPIYDAFAQQVPGGADLVSKAQALAK